MLSRTHSNAILASHIPEKKLLICPPNSFRNQLSIGRPPTVLSESVLDNHHSTHTVVAGHGWILGRAESERAHPVLDGHDDDPLGGEIAGDVLGSALSRSLFFCQCFRPSQSQSNSRKAIANAWNIYPEITLGVFFVWKCFKCKISDMWGYGNDYTFRNGKKKDTSCALPVAKAPPWTTTKTGRPCVQESLFSARQSHNKDRKNDHTCRRRNRRCVDVQVQAIFAVGRTSDLQRILILRILYSPDWAFTGFGSDHHFERNTITVRTGILWGFGIFRCRLWTILHLPECTCSAASWSRGRPTSCSSGVVSGLHWR